MTEQSGVGAGQGRAASGLSIHTLAANARAQAQAPATDHTELRSPVEPGVRQEARRAAQRLLRVLLEAAGQAQGCVQVPHGAAAAAAAGGDARGSPGSSGAVVIISGSRWIWAPTVPLQQDDVVVPAHEAAWLLRRALAPDGHLQQGAGCISCCSLKCSAALLEPQISRWPRACAPSCCGWR